MLFWIVAGALALTVTLFLIRALVSGGGDDEHPAAYDLRVFRDQLKEVERDLARGVVSEEDAGRLRLELSRKVLAADAALKADGAAMQSGGRNSLVIGLVIGAALIGGGLGLYWQYGAPGYPDMGLKARIAQAQETRSTRISQKEFEEQMPAMPVDPSIPADFLALLERLRETVQERPDDLQGLTLLTRNEAAVGNFTAAYEAQAQVIRVKGDAVTSDDYVDFADLLIMAANGYVSPEAEVALTSALRLEETHPIARYYMGLMMAQTGRPDVTFRVWRQLLNEGPANAPWIVPIREQILDAAALAGVDYQLPPLADLAGPSAEDIAAAGEMSAEDQQDMIRGMVARLSERLATEGGSPAEWSRLISSLGILGETEQASAIWNEAQVVFAADPSGLEQVRQGAVAAGVAE